MSATSLKSSRITNKYVAPYTFKVPYFQSFSSSVTWVCPTGLTSVSAVLIGGGGGGGGKAGSYGGGGGGAGGVLVQTISPTPGQQYSIVVGGGGAGSTGGAGDLGTNGGDSSITFLSNTAKGGGRGASNTSAQGLAGSQGSGGGGGGTAAAGTATSGQGNNGGAGNAGGDKGGGGGGYGAAGSAASTSVAGNGGNGGLLDIRNYNVNFQGNPTFENFFTIAAGGGGGSWGNTNYGSGGSAVYGFGGVGGSSYSVGTDYIATAAGNGFSGGGGGGGGANQLNGANGGGGFVLLFGFIECTAKVPVKTNLDASGDKVLYCWTPSISSLDIIDFNKVTEWNFYPITGNPYFNQLNGSPGTVQSTTGTIATQNLSGWNAGSIIFPPFGQQFNSTLYFDISGAPGGSGGADSLTGNAAGGYTHIVTGIAVRNLSGALFVSCGSRGGNGLNFSTGSGGGGGGNGYMCGGRGGNAGSSGNSGGGGGGGAVSVIIDSNSGYYALVAGGSGGGGGSLNRGGGVGGGAIDNGAATGGNGGVIYPGGVLYFRQGADKGAGDGGGGGGTGAGLTTVNGGAAGTDNVSSATGGSGNYSWRITGSTLSNGTSATNPRIKMYI